MSVTLTRRTGVLELPAGQVRAALGELLGEPGAGQTLRRAGLLDAAGEPDPALLLVRRVIADPGSGRLTLASEDRTMHGRISEQHSVVVTPSDAAERARVVPMPTNFLPKCVLRAVGLLSAGSTREPRSPLLWTFSTSSGVHEGDRDFMRVVDDGRACQSLDPADRKSVV